MRVRLVSALAVAAAVSGVVCSARVSAQTSSATKGPAVSKSARTWTPPRETGAGPIHRFEDYNSRNSRAWFVIDPADGRVPPLTDEGRERARQAAGKRRGGNGFEWSVTLDDPHTWARPWTFAMNLTKDPSKPVFEYACHEGNYGMSNILSAARAEDAKAAAAK
jgi:hypothetical protein